MAGAQVPILVQELLLNKPLPQLTENKKNNVPQSKMCFVLDESVHTVIAIDVASAATAANTDGT